MQSRAHPQSWTPPPWLPPSWQQQAWQAPHRLKNPPMSCHPHQQLLLQQTGQSTLMQKVTSQQQNKAAQKSTGWAWACSQQHLLCSTGATSLCNKMAHGAAKSTPCSALCARQGETQKLHTRQCTSPQEQAGILGSIHVTARQSSVMLTDLLPGVPWLQPRELACP